MATKQDSKSSGLTSTTLICFGLSLIIFGIVSWSIFSIGLPDELNEIGDAVAGFASALAFIWLVGGYFTQQKELRQTRQEYEHMRRNSDIQAGVARREHTVQSCKSFLGVLDRAIDNIEAQLKILCPIIKVELEIPHYYGVGFIAKKIPALEKDGSVNLERLGSFAPAIRKEVERFESTYAKMIDYLDSADDGIWVKSIIVEGSVYSDLMDIIALAKREEGLIQKFFGS